MKKKRKKGLVKKERRRNKINNESQNVTSSDTKGKKEELGLRGREINQG